MSPQDALRQAYLDSVIEIRFPSGPLLVTPAAPGTTDGDFPARISHVHVITACNPYSQALDPPENVARNASLARDLDDAGLRHLDAIGRSPDGTWSEPSFAVLDASEDLVLDLADRHDQHAVFAWTRHARVVVWAGEHRGERDVQGWRARLARGGA